MPKAEIPLVNYFNFQYVGTVFYGGGGGKKPEPIKVIFDTGSSWTWVQLQGCKTVDNYNNVIANQCTKLPKEYDNS